MHISRLLCAPLPEKAATRGTSDDLQLQAIPDASVDKLAVSKITTVPCDSSDSPFRVVEIKASFLFSWSIVPCLNSASRVRSSTGVRRADQYKCMLFRSDTRSIPHRLGQRLRRFEVKSGRGSTKTVRCGFCKKRGHYRKTCPVSLASTPVYYPAKAKVDLPTCGVQIEDMPGTPKRKTKYSARPLAGVVVGAAYAEEKATTARPAPIVVREGSRGQTRRMKGLKEGAADDHIEGSRVR
ncbi:hypothetical protein R3P38DRAFT_2816480 [Favolaschia claudopus]|uniref:CCHC-type domain-containing protein n=1 Tax=Favolaschia claudopus TaxID=2862362 RepID=A0AAV9YYN5_9AGAR